MTRIVLSWTMLKLSFCDKINRKALWERDWGVVALVNTTLSKKYEEI